MQNLSKPSDATDATSDYFIDMIVELAAQARASGEIEVALHLEALAAARRHKLLRETK